LRVLQSEVDFAVATFVFLSHRYLQFPASRHSRKISGSVREVKRSFAQNSGKPKLHGRDEVVVIAAEEFRRLRGSATGQALVEAMQASPHRDIEIAPRRGAMPVRDVSL
jgi:hypothetical protein